MRRLLFALTLMVLLLSAWPAGACGDKLLILGRGVRFQIDTADYPAAILLYMNPNLPGSAAVGDTQLQFVMKQAGHRLRSVRSMDELIAALKSGRYDIVLADLSDAPRLEEMVQSAPSRPVLLPWVYQGSEADRSSAEKRYGLFLKAPAKVNQVLSTIDRTMESKPKLVQLRSKAPAKQISLLQ